MPGLEAMENTVNFSVIPEFTERMEGGGKSVERPSRSYPADTTRWEAEGSA